MNDVTATAEVKKLKFCEKTSEGMTVTFSFGNGEVRSLDLSTLSEDMLNNLAVHGALQKIGDSYASAGGDYGFAIASAEKVMENLANDLWGNARSAGEGKAKVGELAAALASLQSKDVAEVTIALENATDEQKKELRAHPAVKAEIAKIRATKAAEALAKAGVKGILNF